MKIVENGVNIIKPTRYQSGGIGCSRVLSKTRSMCCWAHIW